MNNLLKKSYVFMIGLLVASSLYAMENQSNQPFNIENARTKEDFEHWLEQEIAFVWQRLQRAYGITQQDLEVLKQHYAQEYSDYVNVMVIQDDTHEEIPENLMTVIKGVYTDFGISQPTARIVPFAHPSARAGSTDTVLFVKPVSLPDRMPLDLKKYLLALAISLGVGKFHSTDFIFEKLRVEGRIQNPAELEEAMGLYRRLKAVVSNMRSMLLGAEYRAGQEYHMKAVVAASGDTIDEVDMACSIIGQLMREQLD